MESDIGTDSSRRADDRASILRRILGNFAIVLGGTGAAAVLGLIALGLNARALGAGGIGALALVTTAAALVTRVFAFQSWVPLIKLGAEALETGNKTRIADLARVALVLDIAAGLAGMIFGMAFVLLVGSEIGIPAYAIAPAVIYMLSIATGATDTAAGLLRLLNRFAVVTSFQIIGAALTCLYAAVLYVLRADLTAYILGYAAIAAITNVALQTTGLIVAKRAGIPITFARLNESWRTSGWEMLSFSWATSLTGTAYVLRENVPLLAVGAFLGPGAAGLFHVASRVAGVLSMAMWAMSQSLYAEAAHLAASKRYTDLTWLVVRTSVYLGALGLAALLFAIVGGPTILALLAGQRYVAASAALTLLIAAQGFSGVNVGFRGALPLTAGPNKLLAANLTGLVAFAIVLITVTPWLGVPGAAVAQLVFELVALAVSAWHYRRWQQRVPGSALQL